MKAPIPTHLLRDTTGIPGDYRDKYYEDPDWIADYRASGFGLPGGDGSHWRISYVYPRAARPNLYADDSGSRSTWLLAREFLTCDVHSPHHRPGDRVVVLAGPWSIAEAEFHGEAFADEHPAPNGEIDLALVITWLIEQGL